MRYLQRIAAVLYVLSWLLWATSKIGVATISTPITWHGAWFFAFVIAMGVAFGWVARGEHEQSRK